MSDTGRNFTNPEIIAARDEWQGLRNDLSSAEQRIRKIIANQLWLPLGYLDFKAAWKAELADCDLGIRALRHVVYQYLDENATVEEIAEEVHGVGIPTAEALSRDREAGVPVDQSTTHVRSHPRTLRPHTLHLYVGAENMDQYHEDAEVMGISVMGVALEAVEMRFKELHEQAATKVNAWRTHDNQPTGV